MQPDSIIPDQTNPQSWNRYSYVENRPVSLNDPTGHDSACGSSYSDPECEELVPLKKTNPQPGGGGGGNCGGIGQKRCDGRPPTYGDGLIGPSEPPYDTFHTEFQMFLVTDPYYYGESANNTYTGFNGSGDTGNGNPADKLGLLNDFLLGISPAISKARSPYDQDVYLQYATTYQNIPRVNATSTSTLTGMQIRNNSSYIAGLINYTISISGTGVRQSVVRTTSAAPGHTTDVSLPSNINMNPGGVNISITAFTGCTGPCITSGNFLVFRGFISFTVNP